MRRGLLACLLIGVAMNALAASGRYDAMGADKIRYGLTRTAEGLEIMVLGAGVDRPDQAVFVALGNGRGGSALVPPSRGEDGSAVWLPFQAQTILSARMVEGGATPFLRRWKQTQWGPRGPAEGAFTVTAEPAQLTIRIPAKLLPADTDFDLVVYLKDMAANDGMGRLYGGIGPTTLAGLHERTLRHYLRVAKGKEGTTFRLTGRTDPAAAKMKIYQLLPRLFGNANETRKPNGTLAENGSGKFSDLSDEALAEIKAMGFTHLWLTGVLQQATATDYSAIGEPADDPDLLKGMAGSPYAIKDYFDLCPDYADDPARRLEEFKALLGRIHAQGMRVLIDFVPNHVARSHQSTINPALSFGASDDRTKFFDPQNNFFYLTGDVDVAGEGPPLRLPTVDGNGRPTSPTVQASEQPGDGLFPGESEFGRVTGNDVVSWAPRADTWYETVKLNYGYDFRDPNKATRRYPHGDKPDLPVPDTWKKMDEIIAYWQGVGVDGFRADMAHMVPPEFWRWMIGRARERKPETCFVAEAYETDPAKVPGSDAAAEQVTQGSVMLGLLNAGFDSVYDDPTYDALKALYDGEGSANDLDRAGRNQFFFDNALQYAENHDEVRLAARSQWGGHGAEVGRPVSALLFGLSRGPVMVYHGQEVGEPAEGAEGFGGDDARTSIFDYWTMPELAKWVNEGKFDGGRLSDAQRNLREFYRRLLKAVDQPAFRDGEFYPLNPDNLDFEDYGRVGDEPSGRWLYSYLRYDPVSGQRMLVAVNLHPTETMRGVRVRFSRPAMRFLGWDFLAGSKTVPVTATDRLGEVPGAVAEITTTPAEMQDPGLLLTELPPLTAAYFELQSPLPPPGR